jgi:hypothetical protein
MTWIFWIEFPFFLLAVVLGYYLGRSEGHLSGSDRRVLRRSTSNLRRAVLAAQTSRQPGSRRREQKMANAIVGTLTAEVTETIGVIQSAVVLINGFKSRQEAAIAAALANGATEAELQPLYDLNVALDTESSALAAAVLANAEVAPVEPV